MSGRRDVYLSAKLRVAADAIADVAHGLREEQRLKVVDRLTAAILATRKVARHLDTGEPITD